MALYVDMLNQIIRESDLSKMGLTVRAVARENHFALLISKRQWAEASEVHSIFLTDEVNKVMTRCNATGMVVTLEATP